jgi:hypothetical protein
VVDDVDAGEELEPEVHMANTVQLPATADSARTDKDESDARIKQIQVNKLCIRITFLMTLTAALATVSVPVIWLRELPTSHFEDPCGICGGQKSAWTSFPPGTSYAPCQYHSANAPYSFIHRQCNLISATDSVITPFRICREMHLVACWATSRNMSRMRNGNWKGQHICMGNI